MALIKSTYRAEGKARMARAEARATAAETAEALAEIAAVVPCSECGNETANPSGFCTGCIQAANYD